jgi:hypothetical protein
MSRYIAVVIGNNDNALKYDRPYAERLVDHINGFIADTAFLILDYDFYSDNSLQNNAVLSIGSPDANRVTKEINSIYSDAIPTLGSEHLNGTVSIVGGVHGHEPPYSLFDPCIAVWGNLWQDTALGVDYLINGGGRFWILETIESINMMEYLILEKPNTWVKRYWKL